MRFEYEDERPALASSGSDLHSLAWVRTRSNTGHDPGVRDNMDDRRERGAYDAASVEGREPNMSFLSRVRPLETISQYLERLAVSAGVRSEQSMVSKRLEPIFGRV